MRKKLRLFVWDNHCPDYTSGLAFAIAMDEADARKIITKVRGAEPYQWGELTVYPLTKKVARSISGGS
jgi:hypothetical protein